MSKPDSSRGSLMGLKLNLPAIPKVAPVHTTSEMEQRILGGASSVDGLANEVIRKDSLMDVKTSTSEAHEQTGLAESGVDIKTSLHTVVGSRKKEPTVLMNAKLPFSLHSRLKRTAQFNDISMTDILIRAIEVELSRGQYAAPPETWGSDKP